MAREFNVPGCILTGTGALEAAADSMAKMGKKALIVTDPMMLELGNCAKVEQKAAISWLVWAAAALWIP